jgi:single-stranded DNA-binding protein
MAKVKIEGFLGNDPDVGSSDKSQYSILNIAENRRRFNRELDQFESLDPNWFSVFCFGKNLEVSKNLKKGDLVDIEASLIPKAENVNDKTVNTLKLRAERIRKIELIKKNGAGESTPDFYSPDEIRFE